MDQERKRLLNKINTMIDADFSACAFELFQYQYRHNPIYRQFATLTNRTPAQVEHIWEIPFLPISFFKTHRIQTGHWTTQHLFKSSGTSSRRRSVHAVRDIHWYLAHAVRLFEQSYRPLAGMRVLALLPSYLSAGNSSLVSMAAAFIERSGHTDSRFVLNQIPQLIQLLRNSSEPTLLLGVSYALLDLAEQHSLPLRNTIIMETGGMKGRRKEWVRADLHQVLSQAFEVDSIHSEYGMTELFSQAYSKRDGIFAMPETMHVKIYDPTDAFTPLPNHRNGRIHIIDLANVDTCAFIATDDMGRLLGNGQFEVLGRMDHTEARGCNLLLH